MLIGSFCVEIYATLGYVFESFLERKKIFEPENYGFDDYR